LAASSRRARHGPALPCRALFSTFFTVATLKPTPCDRDEREFDRDKLPSSLRHGLIETVEARLKCSSCGAKAAKLLFGSYITS
jgi:hypothetical protein